MAMDDHYAILRVSPDAAIGDIRSAYRDLMRRYHPDVNRSRGAGAKAKAINEAYACLRDPSKRASYDRDRAADKAPPPRRTSSPPPPPPPDMVWTVADVGGWRRPRWGRPTWWQALGLAGASIVTVMTFTATSATPPFVPPPAAPKRTVWFTNPEAARPGNPDTPESPRPTRD